MINLAEELLQTPGIDSHSPAYYYGDLTLSREELLRHVLSVAWGLSKSGAAADDRVVLMLCDTPALPILFLATLSLGAIPVAINPYSSHETIRYILRDSLARFAIVEESQWQRLRDDLTSSEHLDPSKIMIQDLYPCGSASVPLPSLSIKEWARSPSKSSEAFRKKDAESFAFWQYTSGTTGLPKAVQHSAKGILASAECFAKGVLGLQPRDRIYSVPKMFFGYGQGNSLFFPLLTGAAAVLDHEWPTINRVRENLVKYQPSIFFAVPTTFHLLHKEENILSPKALSSVRIAFSAGAPLKVSTFESWKRLYGLEILDGLGATEVGHVFLTNQIGAARPGTTGKPVPGYEVRIVDRSDSPVSPGQQGVLLVRGPSVSPGYWERHEDTKRKFKDGWYRTGDVFKQDEDGYYCYLGREDDLFKVHGRWVIPVEIEMLVLTTHEEVAEAAVVGVDTEDELTIPVLFVVANVHDETRKNTLTADILATLHAALENHKIPRHCYVVPELPRNDNGKIVRRGLVDMAIQFMREQQCL